jgi:hypothetical protein
MEGDDRQKNLQIVTKKLVSLTLAPLSVLFVGAYLAKDFLYTGKGETYLVFLVFLAGLTGGFVSIQQRLPSIRNDELKMLSESWQSTLLIPINGGIFAIILMLMFLSGLVEGEMFPKLNDWFNETAPVDGASVAKLLFWSFVAGFSERFVPQIISKTSSQVEARNQTQDENKEPLINADEKTRSDNT